MFLKQRWNLSLEAEIRLSWSLMFQVRSVERRALRTRTHVTVPFHWVSYSCMYTVYMHMIFFIVHYVNYHIIYLCKYHPIYIYIYYHIITLYKDTLYTWWKRVLSTVDDKPIPPVPSKLLSAIFQGRSEPEAGAIMEIMFGMCWFVGKIYHL